MAMQLLDAAAWRTYNLRSINHLKKGKLTKEERAKRTKITTASDVPAL